MPWRLASDRLCIRSCGKEHRGGATGCTLKWNQWLQTKETKHKQKMNQHPRPHPHIGNGERQQLQKGCTAAPSCSYGLGLDSFFSILSACTRIYMLIWASKCWLWMYRWCLNRFANWLAGSLYNHYWHNGGDEEAICPFTWSCHQFLQYLLLSQIRTDWLVYIFHLSMI